MNWAFMVAGIASLLIAVGHSFVGERFLVMPLIRQQNFPPILGSQDIGKRSLRLTWHVPSIMALSVGALLFTYSLIELDYGSRLAVYSIIPIYGLIAIWVATMSRGRHLAWILFSIVTIGAIAGLL